MTTEGLNIKENRVLSRTEKEIANIVWDFSVKSAANGESIAKFGLIIKKMYEDNLLSEMGKAAYEDCVSKSLKKEDAIALNFSKYIREKSRNVWVY
mgnify:CR=1 FL=1